MMRKDKKLVSLIFFFSMFVIIGFMLLSFASAATCNLAVTLVNQDPYPAIPGEYVEIVFQLTGLENPECGGAEFTFIEQYPFSLDKNDSAKQILLGSTYTTGFKKSWIIPYKVRIDEDALNGEQEITVEYSNRKSPAESLISKKFNISLEDTRTDFEIFVKDYDLTTGILTFEILNIGEVDVEGLTLEIKNQENITIKGAHINIVGDLDSNEYTTADFEAIPENGEIIIDIKYTDKIAVRRTVTKTVTYESAYFTDRNNGESSNWWIWIILIIAAVAVIYWHYRMRKKRKRNLR